MAIVLKPDTAGGGVCIEPLRKEAFRSLKQPLRQLWHVRWRKLCIKCRAYLRTAYTARPWSFPLPGACADGDRLVVIRGKQPKSHRQNFFVSDIHFSGSHLQVNHSARQLL